MDSFNFAALPFPAFKMVSRFLTPAELYYTALKLDNNLLERLGQLGNLPRASLDVAVKLDEKRIGFRFEESQNFKIDFPIVLRTGRVIPEPAVTELLDILRNAQTYRIGSVSDITVDLRLMNRPMLTRLMETPCQKLTVIGQPSIMGHEIVSEAFNKAKPTQKFCVTSDIRGEYFPTPPPAHSISLQFCHGFTRANLQELAGKTAEIELRRTCLVSDDVHQFIKAWVESTETTTVTLTVSRKDEKQWSLEKVLGDIQHSEYQNDRRQKSYVITKSETGIPETVRDMSLASDVVRADGLVGSVHITETELFFCVWHNPHEIRQKKEEIEARKQLVDQRVHECRQRLGQLMFRGVDLTGEVERAMRVINATADEAERMRLLREQRVWTRRIRRLARQIEANEIERAPVELEAVELQGLIDTLNAFL